MERIKIGILTYHRAVNYGAFLQCYSLSHALRTHFPQCDIEVIDYETPREFIVRIKGILKSRGLVDFLKKLSLYYNFNKSLKYLPLSKKRAVSNDNKTICKHWGMYYDILIVGSDAVWNSATGKGKLNFYLNGQMKGEKFSYAASSSGFKLSSLSDKTTVSILSDALEQFVYIGVREEKGEHIINQVNPNLTVHRNCDPVCFLDTETHMEGKVLSKLKTKGLDNRPIICLMTKNERVGKAVWAKFHLTHAIVSVYTPNKYSDCCLYDLSPLEFVSFFKYVDVLFSYFFHGCYTCLKNGKPAIAVDEGFDGKGEKTKIQNLYERFGLHNWYYRPNEMDDSELDTMTSVAKEALCHSQEFFLSEAMKKEVKYSDSFFEAIEQAINNVQ